MPEKGVEPSRACAQRILSPPRLPFRHSGIGLLRLGGYVFFRGFVNRLRRLILVPEFFRSAPSERL